VGTTLNQNFGATPATKMKNKKKKRKERLD